MDIDIDCASLHYGMRNISSIETALSDLSSALGGITLDGELSTAGLISKAISTVSAISNTTIPNVKRKLENAKNTLINMDSEAALFFQYVDTGLLDENLNFTAVPLYDQRDYPKIAYSQGSIATSGCGLVSMCMALSYIYNDLITPDKLGAIANRSSSNNEGRMMGAAKAVGAVAKRQDGIYSKELRQLLREGKQVIVLVRNGGHFVLCTGVTDDGRILVNDPYGAWAKSTPYTDAELNKTGGSAWVIDPYANVGNAKTSIGRIKVSNAVVQAINEANSGSGTVKITSKQYIEGVAEATKAKKAKNWKSIIGPTAIELQGGNKRIGGRVSSGAESAVADGLGKSDSSDTDKKTDTSKTDTGSDTTKTDTGSNNNTDSNYSGSNDYGYSYTGGSSSGGSRSSNGSTSKVLEGALATGPTETKPEAEKVTKVTESTTTEKVSESAKIFAKNNEILSRNKTTEETKVPNPTNEEPTRTTSQPTADETAQTTVQTTPTSEPTQSTAAPEPTQEVVQNQPTQVANTSGQPVENIDSQVVQTQEGTAVIANSGENIESYTPPAAAPSPVVNNAEQVVSSAPEPSSILNNYHSTPTTENNVIIEEPLNPRETETVQRPNEPVQTPEEKVTPEKVTEEQVVDEKVPNPTEEDTTRQPVIYDRNEDGEIEEYDADEMYERNKPEIEDEPIISESTEVENTSSSITSQETVETPKKTNNVATAVLTVGAIAGVGAASYATYKAVQKKKNE